MIIFSCVGNNHSPTILLTCGVTGEVYPQFFLHYALYMCSSQADNRKMVGENDESMTEKKRERGWKLNKLSR